MSMCTYVCGTIEPRWRYDYSPELINRTTIDYKERKVLTAGSNNMIYGYDLMSTGTSGGVSRSIAFSPMLIEYDGDRDIIVVGALLNISIFKKQPGYTIVLEGELNYNWIRDIQCMIVVTNTSYLLVVPWGNDIYRFNLDYLSNGYDKFYWAAVGFYGYRIVRRTGSKSNWFAFTSNEFYLHQIDYTNMNYSLFTMPNLETLIIHVTIDYVSEDHLYVCGRDYNTIKRLKLDGVNAGSVVKVISLNKANSVNGISNMINVQCIGINMMVVTDDAMIIIIDLLNYNEIDRFDSILYIRNIKKHSMSSNIYVDGSSIYFSVIRENSNSFQLYRLYLPSLNCSTFGRYYEKINDTCVKKEDIPSRFGINSSNNSIEACIDAYCTHCEDDYKICTVCETDANSTYRYLYTTDGRCYSQSTMPVKYGPNLTSSLVVSCRDVHCIDCSYNYIKCSKCDSSTAYRYLNIDDYTCYSIRNMPIGKGADIENDTVRSCSEVHCIDCKSNYSFCTQCDDTSYFKYLHASTGICYSLMNMPERFGINKRDDKVVDCVDKNCIDCRDNRDICVGCDINRDYLLDGTYCIKKKDKNIIVSNTRFSPSSSQASVVFSKPIKSEVLGGYLRLELRNEIGSVRVNKSIGSEQYQIFSEEGELKVNLHLREIIEYSTLFIHSTARQPTNQSLAPLFIIQSDDDRSYFDSYHIEIRDIVGVVDSLLVTIPPKVATNIITSILTVSSIILMSSNPAAAILLDRLVTNAFYQSALNGPIVIYPERVLRILNTIELLPINLPDYLGDWAKGGEDCEINPKLQSNEIYCNILINYGAAIFILGLLFMVNLSVEFLIRKSKKKITEKRREKKKNVDKETDLPPKEEDKSVVYEKEVEGNITRIIIRKKISVYYQVIDRISNQMKLNLGIRYSVVKMEGIQLELISYSFINILNSENNSRMNIGTIISSIILGFYSLLGYKIFLITRFGYKLIFGKNKSKIGAEIKQTQSQTQSPTNGESMDPINQTKKLSNNNESQVNILINNNLENSVNQLIVEQTPKKVKEEKEEKKDLIDDDDFKKCKNEYFLVFFSQLKYPKRKIQICIPLITYLRSIFISVLVFVLISKPFLQVGSVMIIEAAYMMIIMIYLKKNEVGENVIERLNSVINLLYVILKFFTLFDIHQHIRQYRYGVIMALVLILGALCNILYMGYSLYFIFKYMMIVLKNKCKKLCSDDDDEQKVKPDDSWYEVSIYEYTKNDPVPIPIPIKKKMMNSYRYQDQSMALRVQRHFAQGHTTLGFDPRFPNMTIEEIKEEIERNQMNVKKSVDKEKKMIEKYRKQGIEMFGHSGVNNPFENTNYTPHENDQRLGGIGSGYAMFNPPLSVFNQRVSTIHPKYIKLFPKLN